MRLQDWAEPWPPPAVLCVMLQRHAGPSASCSALDAAHRASASAPRQMLTLPGPNRPSAPHAPLRFDVGDSVQCNTGDCFLRGSVVAVHYTEPYFPQGCSAPYQVRLLRGCLIFAPHDEDTCIRREQTDMIDHNILSHILSQMQTNVIGADDGGTMLPQNHVRALARQAALVERGRQEPHLLEFRRGGSKWIVDCSACEVTTEITHPRQGRTSRVRPAVDLPLLQNIFVNPRVHTGLSRASGAVLSASAPPVHARNSLIHDDVLRWQYVLEQHQDELNLTETETELVLECCRGWIDNFYPTTPDGGYFSVPEAKCGMGSFAVLLLGVMDQIRVHYENGRQVPPCCCPDAQAHIEALQEDRDYHFTAISLTDRVCVKSDRQVKGLNKLADKFADLRPELRFELLQWFYSKATHESMCDEDGQPLPALFEDTHHVYGLQTYDRPAEEVREAKGGVCPCHGSFFPYMGRPPHHFESCQEVAPESDTENP